MKNGGCGGGELKALVVGPLLEDFIFFGFPNKDITLAARKLN